MSSKVDFSKFKNLTEMRQFGIEKNKEFTQFIFRNKDYKSADIIKMEYSVSQFLRENGGKRGVNVALCSEISPESFMLFPAVWAAGCTLVSINNKLSEIQIIEILNMTQSEFIFLSESVYNKISSRLTSCQSLRKIICLNGEVEKTTSLKSILSKSSDYKPSPNRPQDAALILFSSGSTGKPKGIIQTHFNLISEVELVHAEHERVGDPEYLFPYVRKSRVLFNTPLGHTAGTWGLILQLLSGATYILQETAEAGEMLELIEKHQIEAYLYGPPTIYAALIKHPRLKTTNISSMRYWNTAAAPISYERVMELKSILPGKFTIFYGLTETACVITGTDCDEKFVSNSVGNPFPGLQLEIRDSEGKKLPQGEIGEVCLKGKIVSPGYLNLEEETARTFKNGWVHTGDLGYLLENGNLVLCGRSKLLIIQGGVKVFPQTVEAAINSFPGVKESCAVGAPDEILGERVVAFISSVEKNGVSLESLKKFCRERLAEHEVPRQFIFIDEIPRTPTNKMDITLLREMAANPTFQKPNKFTLSADVLRIISSRSQLLGALKKLANQVGVQVEDTHVPLVQSGFTSLKAVEYSILLSEFIGEKISETLLFDHPTLEGVAHFLSKKYLADHPTKNLPRVDKRNSRSQQSKKVAIIGAACRLPGNSNTPDQLWQRLSELHDHLELVPEERWSAADNYSFEPFKDGKIPQLKGGFVKQAGHYDPSFFDMTLNEAKLLDPCQRTVHQLAWECVESSLIRPQQLQELRTGVFIGLSTYDYCHFGYQTDKYSPEVMIGNQPTFIAGRLSHILNLSGPCMVLDTACSSSLVALYHGCQTILSGDAGMAFVGGVTFQLDSTNQKFLAMSGILSPSDQVRTFDVSADGTVRGEGGSMVLLKDLEQAEKDGDRILAVVEAVSVGHDAKTANVAAPSGAAQVRLMKYTLDKAGLEPENVDIIEAHGTGTKLGDAIELNALAEVYGSQKRKENLYLGSVKTHIGHCEAAAGTAGVLKLLGSFSYKQIFPHPHFKKPSTTIDWSENKFTVATQQVPLKKSKIFGAVSSFGYGGTIAHAIFSSYDRKAKVDQSFSNKSNVNILCLSAKSTKSFKNLAMKYIHLVQSQPDLDYKALCYTANTRRQHFHLRKAIVFSDKNSLLRGLESLLQEKNHIDVRNSNKELCFLFSGTGGSALGMGIKLIESQPTFAAAINQCDQIIYKHFKKRFVDLVNDKKAMSDFVFAQAALFSLQYALHKMFESWGVKPKHVLGHSGGEFTAAVVSGALTFEEAFEAFIERSHLLNKLDRTYEIGTALITQDELLSQIHKAGLNVNVFGFNAPNSFAFSGPKEQVVALVKHLKDHDFQARALDSSFGAHSEWVEPILKPYKSYLEKNIKPQVALLNYYSSFLGRKLNEDEKLDANYWVGLTRKPVHFSQALKSVLDEKVSFFLELSGKPTLTKLGPLNSSDSSLAWISALDSNFSEWEQIATTVAHLYEKNIDIDWDSYYSDQKHQVMDLPLYPFDLVDLGLGNKTQKQTSTESVRDFEKPNLQQNSFEDRLQDVLKNILGTTSPSPESTLNSIGLNSLKAIQLSQAIEKEFGRKMDVTFFVKNPTFSTLLHELSGSTSPQKGSSSQPVRVVQKESGSDLLNWFPGTKKQVQAKYQLFCLHPLAGSAEMFREWTKHFGSDIEVLPVQLPGRENRINENPFTNIETAIQELGQAIKNQIRGPFGFFGYSMGGVLGVLVAEWLKSKHQITPEQGFVFGTWPFSYVRNHKQMSEIFSEQRIKELLELPVEIAKSPELFKFIFDRAMADAGLLKSINYNLEPEMNYPFYALAGDKDVDHSEEILKAWSKNAKAGFQLKVIKNCTHIFKGQQEAEVIQFLKDVILKDLQKTMKKAG